MGMRPGTGHRGKNIAGPHVALESSNLKNLICGYGFFKKRTRRAAFIGIGKPASPRHAGKWHQPHAMGAFN
ncbi:hypothetical protein EV217_0440 [Phyllobacterium myrsinacearum]|nr:hypothetical protein EV217_0440 [Phyllobacterium myrsinacearum]